METQVYFNTICVYTFLEHIFVFFCKVQGVKCVLYTQQTDKFSVNKEDFRFK